MLRYVFIALGLVLSGCSLSPQACAVADWHAMGYEDGSDGKPDTTFGRYRADCAEHGIPADFAAYLAGHGQGVMNYCRPSNGYRLGNRGKSYQDVCPRELEPAFVAAHSAGYGLYNRRATIRELSRDLDDSVDRVDEIDDLISDITGRLAGSGLTPQEGASLAVDLRQLSEERAELKYTIHDLELDVDAAERDFESHRARTAARYGG